MRRLIGVLVCLTLGVMALSATAASASTQRSAVLSSTHAMARVHASRFGLTFNCPTPGSKPNFIAILVQGIGSYVQSNPANDNSGEVTSFNPAKTSYCATSPEYAGTYPKGDRFTPPRETKTSYPPNNPSIVLRSMANGWLNYSYNFFGGTYIPGSPSTDPSSVYPGNGEDLINELADAGGYVLPYSYCCDAGPAGKIPLGAFMTGTSANPKFNFFSYNSHDVAQGDPSFTDPPVLNNEIISINKVFPDVPIFIIGHSNGGLIAEQWWLRYGTKPPCGTVNGQPQCGMHGVEHVFTLDSPINGVSAADDCDNGFSLDPVGYLLGIAVNTACSGAVGSTVAGEYSALWQSNLVNPFPFGKPFGDQGEGDPLIAYMDTGNGSGPDVPGDFPGHDPQPNTFTAVGTYGDPLYDGSDPSLAESYLGMLSQIVFSPKCLVNTDLAASQCAPLNGPGSKTVPPLDWVNPCAGNYQSSDDSYSHEADGSFGPIPIPTPIPGVVLHYNLYGLTTSLYIHSEAKNCPGTVNMITNYIRQFVPPPPLGFPHPPKRPAPTPTGSTGSTPPAVPADALACWKTTPTATDLQTVFGACADDLASAPGVDGELTWPSQIAQLDQLSGIPFGAGLSEDTPQQQAEAKADIAALDTFFATPGLEPSGAGSDGAARSTPTPTPTPTTPSPT